MINEAYKEHFYNLPDKNKVQLLSDLRDSHDGATNFTSFLMRLIIKSDSINKMKLFNEYPSEVSIVHLWQNCPDVLNSNYTWTER